MISTKILGTQYTPREALIMLLNTDSTLDIQDIEDVYYPYIRMRFQMSVGKDRKFIKKLVKYVDCIIDRVSGTAYDTVYDKNTDSKPYYVDVEFDEEDALESVLSVEQCRNKGHDFALKQYIGKAKLMFTPDIEIIEEEQFYKKFYVITCRDKEGMHYFIMVDAVDGGISVLDHEQHIDTLVKMGEYDQIKAIADGGLLESMAEEEYLEEEIVEEDYPEEGVTR
ncbi:MAG: hypothetical protein SO262_04370 [Lentihominibacter sp.]|nr:hypothetical protein [Lentihominibacter sp.]